MEGQGQLEGYNGKYIWIDTKSGLYVIGKGRDGFNALQAKIAQELGDEEKVDQNRSCFRVYSRRIGELDRIGNSTPLKMEIFRNRIKAINPDIPIN